LDAKVRLLSVRGERLVDVDRFCLGRKRTDLKDDELIAEILLPKTGLERYYYEKVGGRKALAISRVSFAGIFAEENGRITKLSAAFGAVSDTVLRFRDLEMMLIGKTGEEAKAKKALFLNTYAERLNITEGRVSAEYRRAVCLNLLGVFLEKFGI
jgi:CO/xanthine dehydrogenase FAD-binding subunit